MVKAGFIESLHQLLKSGKAKIVNFELTIDIYWVLVQYISHNSTKAERQVLYYPIGEISLIGLSKQPFQAECITGFITFCNSKTQGKNEIKKAFYNRLQELESVGNVENE